VYKASPDHCRISMVLRAIAACLLISPVVAASLAETYVTRGRTIRYTPSPHAARGDCFPITAA